MFVKPPFPEEQDGITMSPVGREGVELCSECYVFFHNALPCSSVVRWKEAMDQDVDFTSIFSFSDFCEFVILKIFQNNY